MMVRKEVKEEGGGFHNVNQTLTVELDNMDRMLIQMELTVMAGDHESYRISANTEHDSECQFVVQLAAIYSLEENKNKVVFTNFLLHQPRIKVTLFCVIYFHNLHVNSQYFEQ